MLVRKITFVVCFLFLNLGCATFSGSKKFDFVNNERFEVPSIVLNEDWQRVDSFEHPLTPSQPIVWRKVVYYKHLEKQWFKSDQEYFGQKIFEAFGVYDDRDNLVGHWFVLKKEGKTFLLESSDVRFNWLENNSNEITGVEIFFLDKSGHILISRAVSKD